MEKNEIKCPKCGSSMITELGYNYETALIDYHCRECDYFFKDNQIKRCEECDNQVIEGGEVFFEDILFCSDNCREKFKQKNNII